MDDMNTLLPDIKLRFNIEHPSFEECYAQGYESALLEMSEEENPFISGTKESEQWLEGWWAGFYGEQPIYDLSAYLRGHEAESAAVAANDQEYHESMGDFLTKVLEITGVIAISAFVGYQVLDLVA